MPNPHSPAASQSSEARPPPAVTPRSPRPQAPPAPAGRPHHRASRPSATSANRSYSSAPSLLRYETSASGPPLSPLHAASSRRSGRRRTPARTPRSTPASGAGPSW